MSDTVIKFKGGECHAASCGSKSQNPLVAIIANAMLQEANGFSVAHAQDAQLQSIGSAMKDSGIAI